MNRVLLLLASACLAGPLPGHEIGPADFLAAKGPVLRADHGRGAVVTLRGTNLGGWLMQEDWMSPGGYGSVPRDAWRLMAPGEDARAAIDGRMSTVWEGPGDAVLTLSLGSLQTFGRLALRTPAGDAPPEVAVAVSADGRAWKALSAKRSEAAPGVQVFVLSEEPTCAYVRLTGRAPAKARLRIAEIELLQADDYTERSTLLRRFGQAEADRIVALHQATWIQASDLDEIAGLGLNLVRVPMNWLDFMREDGTWREDAYGRLDWLVAECARRGIYVILDLHAAPGGASTWQSSGFAGDDGTGRNPHGLWTRAVYQDRTEQIWRRLARHFRGNPAVAGYDLLNEPVVSGDESARAGQAYSDAAELKTRLFDRLYRAVRQEDPDHVIVIAAFAIMPADDGRDRPQSGFAGILPPSASGWTNVLYQTHHYDMEHADSLEAQRAFARRALATIARYQKAWDVPVYAGEYCYYEFPEVWTEWMRGLNALHVSWSNWAYKVRGDADSDGGNWGFYNLDRAPAPEPWLDSPGTICDRLKAFSTRDFKANRALMDLVRACAVKQSDEPR